MTPMPAISTVILRTQGDDKLVVHARNGHERAFEAICDRYRAELGRALRRYLPPARVDDVLQQTFISAWSAFQRDADVRELRPWLHRIARNAALADLKRPGYDHAELHDAMTFGAADDDVIEQRDIVRRTLAGVASLPEKQRAALLAIAVEGRPSAEVAEELGMSDPATRQMLRRARMSLRAAVGAFVPSPLLTWALTAGHTVAAGEGAVGGALGAGATAVVLKAGAALTAGAIVASAPAVIHHQQQVAKHRAVVVADAAPGRFVAAAHRSAGASRGVVAAGAVAGARTGAAAGGTGSDRVTTRSATGRAHVAATDGGVLPAADPGVSPAVPVTTTTPAAAPTSPTASGSSKKVSVIWPWWRPKTGSPPSRPSGGRHRDRPSHWQRPERPSGSGGPGSTQTHGQTTTTASTTPSRTTTTPTSTAPSSDTETTPTAPSSDTDTTPASTTTSGDDTTATTPAAQSTDSSSGSGSGADAGAAGSTADAAGSAQ